VLSRYCGHSFQEEFNQVTRGEEAQVLTDYDLFGTNIKDETVIYISTSVTNNKHLFYVPLTGEWAELKEEQINWIQPGFISDENREFVSRIKRMVITYGT